MLKAIAVSKMKKEERVLMCDKGGEGLADAVSKELLK